MTFYLFIHKKRYFVNIPNLEIGFFEFVLCSYLGDLCQI